VRRTGRTGSFLPRRLGAGSLHRGLTVAHTGHLDGATLASVRALLDEAFDGDFADEDWEHALGGMHVLAFDGARLIGHGAVVQRRLVHGGRALRAGYVEAVAVVPALQRRGHAATIMDALEHLICGAYDLGALSATDDGAGLYLSRGWQPWRGPTSALTPAGTVPTPEDDGSVFVLPVSADLDPAGELTCDWRDGDLW
jgi:aminoglycoside 2'-N-acetyltransferase I